MKTISRALLDEAMKPIWEIKNQIYEETKNMTPEEKDEYYNKKSEAALQLMQQINPDDYDLSFLHKKQDE